MKRNLFRNIGIIVLVALIASCTKYYNPEPKYEEYEQELDKTVKRKVLIISIDGLVGRELKKKIPVNIAELIKTGKYSFDALTDINTSDVASWATMMTGYSSNRHHIENDSYLPGANSDDPHGEVNFVPSFIYRLEDKEPSIRTSIVVQDAGLGNVLLMDADDNILADSDEKVKKEAVSLLSKVSPDLMVVQFKDVLRAGITTGFSIEETTYADAIKAVDSYIGEIIKTIKAKESYPYEDWLIVVNSSHGGLGKSYGGESFQERNIFTLYSQKNFVSQELKAEVMSTSRFWGHTNSPLGVRALNKDANASDYFNMDNSGELTVEIKYNWASPKTVPWSGNYTPVGDNTFWYAPLVAKKSTVAGGNVGWGFYSWNVNIVFTISDGSKSVNIETNRENGKWGILTARVKKVGNDAHISLFRNGAIVSTSIITGFNFSVTNTLPFIVGCPNTINYELPDFKMANLRIWKRSLSDDEIRKNACKVELTKEDLEDTKVIGEWDLKYADNKKINNRLTTGKNLEFEGVQPSFATEQFFSPCPQDNSEVLIQNTDVASQVFYWLGIKPSDNWALEGTVFLSKYEIEFLK